jgi:hypothetical protein
LYTPVDVQLGAQEDYRRLGLKYKQAILLSEIKSSHEFCQHLEDFFEKDAENNLLLIVASNSPQHRNDRQQLQFVLGIIDEMRLSYE